MAEVVVEIIITGSKSVITVMTILIMTITTTLVILITTIGILTTRSMTVTTLKVATKGTAIIGVMILPSPILLPLRLPTPLWLSMLLLSDTTMINTEADKTDTVLQI